jgi:hypothetical protein
MKTLALILLAVGTMLAGGCVTQADTAANLNAVNAVVINAIARVNADPLNPNNAHDLADANTAETQALALNAKAVSVNVADLANIVNLAENLIAWMSHNTPWLATTKMGAAVSAPPETPQQLRNDAIIDQFRIQQAANSRPLGS